MIEQYGQQPQPTQNYNTQQPQPQQPSPSSIPSSYTYPNQMSDVQQAIASLSKILLESSKTLSVIRREFRGEALQQFPDGSTNYIQVSKPIFVKMDFKTEKPLKQQVAVTDEQGNKIKKEVYIPNDEAIEEILSMLKFAGINQITNITNIDDDNILDDLKEFECKLAATLCLKQKEWGIDKELLPMIQFKIKTLVQDARYMACNGTILKALQTSVQRIEQSHTFEGEKGKRMMNSPYA